jgi:hypothetical protein
MTTRRHRTLLIVVYLAGAAGLVGYVGYDMLHRLPWRERPDDGSGVRIEPDPAQQDSKDVAGDTELSIEVKPVVKDAEPVYCKAPWEYPGFDKRIKELSGKRVLALLGNKLSIQLLHNRIHWSERRERLTGPDFISAILRGKMVPEGEMVYDLQDSQECVVHTPAGEFRVGIYYRPVGYIVLPNGESYWFFFEKDRQ